MFNTWSPVYKGPYYFGDLKRDPHSENYPFDDRICMITSFFRYRHLSPSLAIVSTRSATRATDAINKLWYGGYPDTTACDTCKRFVAAQKFVAAATGEDEALQLSGEVSSAESHESHTLNPTFSRFRCSTLLLFLMYVNA